MQTILSLKNIHKSFHPDTVNENHVLKGINLDIRSGDFITVIGSNGAGKSSLMNAIAGVFPIDQGDILLHGQSIKDQAAYQRARAIARVFQDPQKGTAPDLSIKENLAMAYKRGQNKSLKPAITPKMEELFKQELAQLNMGLEDRLNTQVRSLSGGQRQVLTLIMASLQVPDILLLDEHTAALDPRASSTILKLTQKLVEERHIPSLMITHNMEDAVKYGNRLIMLHQGQLIYDFSAEDKSQLTVNQLVDLFHQQTRTISDQMLLS